MVGFAIVGFVVIFVVALALFVIAKGGDIGDDDE